MRLGANTSPAYSMMAGAGCVVAAIYTDYFDGPGILAGAIRGRARHELEAVTTLEVGYNDQQLLPDHVGPGYHVLPLRDATDVDGNAETVVRLRGLGSMLRESPAA